MKYLIVIFCTLPLWSVAQLNEEYAWQLTSASDKKTSLKLSPSLNHNGYKIDQASLEKGKLILMVKDLSSIAPVLKKKYNVSIAFDRNNLYKRQLLLFYDLSAGLGRKKNDFSD
jgi:hypothetical protein